uniref:Uncharacterized protein n=1 Tax=Myoviridae sp. ctkfK18 TaxID=2825165 RepID=A0A8S5VGH3_9CAUD|nr:MAG TPA: hypothetical protein [Myoviridae sp. ctkfK18]
MYRKIFDCFIFSFLDFSYFKIPILTNTLY